MQKEFLEEDGSGFIQFRVIFGLVTLEPASSGFSILRLLSRFPFSENLHQTPQIKDQMLISISHGKLPHYLTEIQNHNRFEITSVSKNIL